MGISRYYRNLINTKKDTMKYKSQFREQSDQYKQYIDFYIQALSVIERMLKESQYDDKKRSTFKTNIEHQKYKTKLNEHELEIIKYSIINNVKEVYQKGLIARGFGNKQLAIINEAIGLSSLSSNTPNTNLILSLKEVCTNLYKKIKKLANKSV